MKSETDYTETQEDRQRDEKLDSSRVESHQPGSVDMKYLPQHRLQHDSLFCMISMFAIYYVIVKTMGLYADMCLWSLIIECKHNLQFRKIKIPNN